MSESVIDITSVNVEALLSYCIVNCEKLLVFFNAPWYEPCKQLEAPLERLAASGAVSVVKINAGGGDGDGDAAATAAVGRVMSEYEVSDFPTVLVFKHKTLVQTVVGTNLAQAMTAFS